MAEKRATRWQAEVVDKDGNSLWKILAHDWPDDVLATVLADAGLRVRRTSIPRKTPLKYNYSIHDPVASIVAAREHHDRRATQLSNALMLLIGEAGRWVPRDDIRKHGGDDGPRRVRELRARDWPILTTQLVKGMAWYVKLDLPPSILWEIEKRKKRMMVGVYPPVEGRPVGSDEWDGKT